MPIGLDIGGLLTGIAQAQANSQANALGYENLQLQKKLAKDQYNLATATRTDAYGNTEEYDPVLKKWVTTLTPTQQGIVSAGQREQLATLTEDAARNRTVHRRQEARAEEAVPDYNRALAGFRYDQPKSEGGQFGELVTLLASSRDRNVHEAQAGLGRQAMRMGKGSSIPEIVKASNDYLGEAAPDNILQARQEARSEHAQDVATHNAEYLPALEHFAGVEDAVGGTNPYYSNTPEAMAGTQSQMIAAIGNAIAQGGAGVGNAYGNLASSASRVPNLSGVFGTLGGGETAKPPGYVNVSPGQSIFDPSTGQVIYQAPFAPGKSGTAGSGAAVASAGGSDYDNALAAISRLTAGNKGTY